MRNLIITLSMLAASTFAGTAYAENFEIKMLNKGIDGSMVFEPDFIEANLGDTITFLPTDKGHNVETLKGMMPDGFKKFKTKFGKEYVLSADIEGVYGFKCSPHYGMGMVALISVGNPVNLEVARKVKHKGKGKKRFKDAFTKLDNSIATTATTN